MSPRFDFEHEMARTAAAGFGDDFFAEGHLARLIEWYRRKTGEEKVSVEVALYSGETFYIAQLSSVEGGFLMFITEGDPHELVFAPASNVAQVHVTKLRAESGQIGFRPDPVADLGPAAS